MSNRWRRKPGSESKPNEPEEAVWGDDDTSEPEDETEVASAADPTAESAAGVTKETGVTGETEPQPEASSAPGATADAPDRQATPSAGPPDAPDETPDSQPSEVATDATPTPPSSRPSDEFDALGAEVAEVLRHTHDLADRVRAEADEQARATIAEAEQQATATMAAAEQQARVQQAEADQEIEQARAEVARQLEEASSVLAAAHERDRTLRSQAEQHRTDAVAAREAGRAILESATERLARAETVAQDLATQVETARLEVGPIAMELQALAEQYGVLVLAERTATTPGGVDGDSTVIDLRDSSTPSSDDPSAEPSAAEPVRDGEADGSERAPSGDGEPTASAESSEQL